MMQCHNGNKKHDSMEHQNAKVMKCQNGHLAMPWWQKTKHDNMTVWHTNMSK